MERILIKNANILTVNADKEILNGFDILIEDGLIKRIEKNINEPVIKTINATGKIVMPGFVQTHVHLCQTLFRGLAEDMPLLDWLRRKIWPLEAAHNQESTYYSSLLGIGELLSGGTTTILDMGGVNYTEQIFKAVAESGIRATCGKAMMDSGEDVPPDILEDSDYSIEQSLELHKKWNGAENGRIKYAFAPRFILSVSDNLFKNISYYADKYNIQVHTHAYENKNEGEEILALKGMREFDYFEKMGLLNKNLLCAHCVHLEDNELKKMVENEVRAIHCPSSNLKLGSGMMNLKRFINAGASVSIGADGTPCNNNLDMLQELRTTALMQKVLNTPDCIEAHKFIELSTIEGAKALGLDKEIGSVEEGKKADLIVLNLGDDFSTFQSDLVDLPTQIVYSASRNNVETVIIDGKIIVADKEILTMEKPKVLFNSKIKLDLLLGRL